MCGLVEARARDRVSQKKKKKGACLIQAEKSAASIVVVREGEVQFVGAVSIGS